MEFITAGWIIGSSVRTRLIFIAVAIPFIYVGTHISVHQDEIWKVTNRLGSAAAVAANRFAEPMNAFFKCIEPLLRMLNNLVSLAQAIISTIATKFGIYIFASTVIGTRGEPVPRAGPVDPLNLCGFFGDLGGFAVAAIDLFKTPVFLALNVLHYVAQTVHDILTLTWHEIVLDLLKDALYAIFDAGQCLVDLPRSLLGCVCYASIDDVPSNFFYGVLGCIDPSLIGVATSVVDFISRLLGLVSLNALLTNLQYAADFIQQVWAWVTQVVGIALDALNGVNGNVKIGSLIDTMSSVINDVADFIEKISKALSISDVRELKANVSRATYVLPDGRVMHNVPTWIANNATAHRRVMQIANIMELYRPLNLTHLAAITARYAALDPVAPLPPMRSIAPPITTRDFDAPTPSWRMAVPVFGERTDAAARFDAAMTAAFTGRAGEAWHQRRLVSGMVSHALLNDSRIHPREWLARLEAAGFDHGKFIGTDTEAQCATQNIRGLTTRAPAPVGAPNWFDVVVMAGFVLVMVVGLSCALPPLIIFFLVLLVLSIFTTLIIALTTGPEIALAIHEGRYNDVGYLPTIIYLAQATAGTYFGGGLSQFNLFAVADELLQHLEADANYFFNTLLRVPLCYNPFALVINTCPRQPKRGVSVLQGAVDLFSCDPWAKCNVTDNCSAGATACVRGECLCWLYSNEQPRWPTFSFSTPVSYRCELAGYNYRELLPSQTGGFSWRNLWAAFESTWAATKFAMRRLSHGTLVPPQAIGFAIFLFIPMLSRPMWAVFVPLVTVVAVQAPVAALGDYLRAHLSAGSYWRTFVDDEADGGVSCVLLNSPALVEVVLMVSVGQIIIAAIGLSGLWKLLYLPKWIARRCSRAYRLFHPAPRAWKRRSPNWAVSE